MDNWQEIPLKDNSTGVRAAMNFAEKDPEPEAPSPFLPGTQIQFAWDSTSLSWLKTCPRLYQYQMLDGWSLKEDAIHLRFGIEYHQALHDYELSKATGITHVDALHDTVRALLIRIADWNPVPRTKSEELKTKFNLLRSIVWYLEKYKDDPAKTIILKDGTPAMELSFKFELDWGPQYAIAGIIEEDPQGELKSNTGRKFKHIEDRTLQPYLLCGHLDRVVDFSGETFVMDRKTSTSTLGSYYFDQYAPDNQMTIYSFAGQVILDAPVKGVIIDAIQIAKDWSRPVRGFTFRTNDQIDEWLRDLRSWLSLAESYATEGYWPQNDTACSKFGGCRFREICSKSPHVREKFLEADFVKAEPQDRWNPLKPR